MIAPAAPPSTTRYRHAIRWLGILAVISLVGWYAGYLILNSAPFAGGSDSSGYFNCARLFATGQFVAPLRTIPELSPENWNAHSYAPLGFIYAPGEDALHPTYPPGLPLHLLLAAQLVGWASAATLISVLAALGGGALFVACSRHFGIPWAWAVGGAALMCACPVYLLYSLQPMSDVLATTWTCAAVYTALRTRKGNWSWALACGVAVGLAVLVRPTNLLILLPVAMIFGRRWKAWLMLVIGGLPSSVFLGYYNFQLYGSFLATGYGDIGPLLSTRFLVHNALHFTKWIPQLLTPIVGLAVLLPWLNRKQHFANALLGLWAVSFIGFYLLYYHSGETWWYLRFILPAFPPLLLAAIWAGHLLLGRRQSSIWSILLPMALLYGGLSYQHRLGRKLGIPAVQSSEGVYPNTAEWLQAHAPANSIMMVMQTSGALFYYTHFTLVRYDFLQPEDFARLSDVARRTGRPIYAPLFPFEVKEALEQRLGGEWEKVATIHFVTIWQFKAPKVPSKTAD